MKHLKKYFKPVRKDSNNTGPYGAPNFPSSFAAERSSVLKFFLLLLVALSVGAVCIENGLHPIALLVLIPVSAALIRRDYDQAYVSSEKVITIVLLIYVAAVIIGIVLIQRRIIIPLFMVYFTFGILIARAILPLNNRAISQLSFLSVGLILINCILTNHLIFGLLLPFYLFVLMGTLLVFLLDRSKRADQNASYPIQQDFSHPVGLLKLVAKYSGLIFIMTIIAFAIIPRPFLTFPGFATVASAGGGLVDLQKVHQLQRYSEYVESPQSGLCRIRRKGISAGLSVLARPRTGQNRRQSVGFHPDTGDLGRAYSSQTHGDFRLQVRAL